eukprot:CAMPEP_0194094258 /NCGR_PEP_ID=MMETSP0149-20130528/53343_1 /TAXON_ID=122233 /ORGANISM="Chaetoceros debilis, Strain MM31A-1" /LENGTH=81 /DNA_ID=CAMNT_0038779849 /DNA_START=369 /DNA_END=614 /DNA_ORIENTATION=-
MTLELQLGSNSSVGEMCGSPATSDFSGVARSRAASMGYPLSVLVMLPKYGMKDLRSMVTKRLLPSSFVIQSRLSALKDLFR